MHLWLLPLLWQPSPPGPVPSAGGGVPLNMKEVEELERMTKDFIRNMDANPPLITSPPTGADTKLQIKTHFYFTRILHLSDLIRE